MSRICLVPIKDGNMYGTIMTYTGNRQGRPVELVGARREQILPIFSHQPGFPVGNWHFYPPIREKETAVPPFYHHYKRPKKGSFRSIFDQHGGIFSFWKIKNSTRITLTLPIHSLRTVMHIYPHAYAHVFDRRIGENPRKSLVFICIRIKFLVEKIIFHNLSKKVGKSVILCRY